MFFACKVGDRKFELPKLTLGEGRILKREFGLEQYEDFNETDPDQLVGLLYLCLKREKPDATHEELIAEVEAMDVHEFASTDDTEEDPTDAAPEAAEVPAVKDVTDVKAGKSAKSRKTTGSQS